jgi:hypothetical protein
MEANELEEQEAFFEMLFSLSHFDFFQDFKFLELNFYQKKTLDWPQLSVLVVNELKELRFLSKIDIETNIVGL